MLDAEALSSIARQRGPRFQEVYAAVEAARRLRRHIVTPAVTLAELYRGPGHNQIVDSCLSRETWVDIRDTDRAFARFVGGVLASARADSSDIADAHVVAAAVQAGGGVILTGDAIDLKRLSAPYSNVQVVPI